MLQIYTKRTVSSYRNDRAAQRNGELKTDLATANDVMNVRYAHIIPPDVSLLLILLRILFEDADFKVGRLEIDGTEKSEVVECVDDGALLGEGDCEVEGGDVELPADRFGCILRLIDQVEKYKGIERGER